jgi:fructosamine-3-kinase
MSYTDLWIGNAGAITDAANRRVPAVFDPACWYGHHEFDLALASLFGGFAPPYSKYTALHPKLALTHQSSDIDRLHVACYKHR